VCAKSIAESEPPIKVDVLVHIFSRYLTTFKKTVATKRKSPTVSEGTEAEEDVNVRISEKATIRLASSSYSGACSALSYLFTEGVMQRHEICGQSYLHTIRAQGDWEEKKSVHLVY
jgi:hypothetical protein